MLLMLILMFSVYVASPSPSQGEDPSSVGFLGFTDPGRGATDRGLLLSPPGQQRLCNLQSSLMKYRQFNQSETIHTFLKVYLKFPFFFYQVNTEWQKIAVIFLLNNDLHCCDTDESPWRLVRMQCQQMSKKHLYYRTLFGTDRIKSKSDP